MSGDDGAARGSRGSPLKRIAVAIVGGLVVLIGIAMMVLPGPAFIVIPIGLSILATQFEAPKRWLKRAEQWGEARLGNRMPRLRHWLHRLQER